MKEEKELKAIKLEFEAELKKMFNTRRDDVGLITTKIEITNDPMTGECLQVKTYGYEIV